MRRVLVVDDDRQMVKTLCGVLRLKGWDPVAAHSGEEAVAAAREQSFSVVLMDVRMPGLNGVEAFREIHRLAPSMPVILMTAYAAHELLAQAEREGVLTILPKPLPLPRLTEILQDLSTRDPVLVVDDDREFLTTLRDVLVKSGHRVATARSVDEAIERLASDAPGIAVMDLRLNGSSEPHDAVLAIKTVSPEVLLILYSGQPGLLDETVQRLPASWVYGTLRKPFAPERLLELLDAACRH
ncbi:MAG TPA: response regulator [Vicinamibacterales bacterium]|nr:response regulator [Vicinamibacterales bacterium]